MTDHSTYSNGFETADSTNDWTQFVTSSDTVVGAGITRVTTGTGLLPVAPASGSYYAVVQNVNDTYQTGFGAGGYTFFGGPQNSFTGPFDQSMAIYINTAWAAPSDPGTPAFWLDETPNHNDPNNFGAEHNFRFWVVGHGSIVVTADGAPESDPVATITTSGWYTFQMVYYKAASPSDPALTDLNVYDASNNLVGSKTGLEATSPGGPMASSDLTGHGYAWLTVWQNGFANNELAIDNMNTEVFPITASATINVADAPPSLAADHPSVTSPEGTTVSNTGTFGDYDEPVTISVLSGGGSIVQTGSQSGTWHWSGPAASDAPYDVTIKATNTDGSFTTVTFHVAFTDVPPTITADLHSVSTFEDVAASNTGTWSDFDDAVILSASQGVVTEHNNGTWSWSQLADETASGTVTITATNSDGSTAFVTFQATFNDRPPNIADQQSTVSAPENGTAVNLGTFGDYDDPVTISVLSGGGSVTQTGTQTGTWKWSGTGDEGTHTVVIEATNSDGSFATVSYSVTFTDVPLTGSNGATAGGTEGILKSSVLANATFTDANPGDHTGDFSGTIHWGDSQSTPFTSADVTYDSGTQKYTIDGSHTYAEDGSYNISIDVVDDGGATTTVTGTATVAEGMLSIGPGTPFTAVETFSTGTQTVASFSDTALEPASGYSATIHWGDGNDTLGNVMQTSPGHFAITGSNTYAAPGSYNISVTLNDDGELTTSGTTDTATVVDRLTVINTNDSGPGSLREVITYANTLLGTSHTIKFAIPAGPQTIQLLSPLPASTVLLFTQLDATQNVTVISPTGGGYDNFGALTKTGDGSLTLEGANNLTGNLEVDAGTLRFDDTVAPTIAPGVTVNVTGTGTLDLSGFVSAFTGGASGTSITNSSSATSGIVISGTSQVVGNVDGTGNLSVDAGSDLTANHIVENALVIGGMAGHFATVTIDASDASGNPLAVGGGAATGAATTTQNSAAPPLATATGTLSLLAVPLSSPASIQAATFTSTAAIAASPATTSDVPAVQSVASATLTVRSTASAGTTAAIGTFEVTVVATEPASASAAAGSQTSAAGAATFSTTPSGPSLDVNAVAAVFDDADVFEWLATEPQSQSSSGEMPGASTPTLCPKSCWHRLANNGLVERKTQPAEHFTATVSTTQPAPVVESDFNRAADSYL